MKQLLKRSLWTAPLILPSFRKPIYWIRQSFSESNAQPSEDSSSLLKNQFEKLFTEHPDPWSYTNRYEQIKYEQTLDMLPDVSIENALELACAEGHFTAQFAPRVKRLLATDITQTALDRCKQRCAAFDNVTFQRLDFLTEAIPGEFDLIVCSEVLYFAGERHQLYPVVEKFVNALKPEGYLIMTHSNVLVDDPSSPGFNWSHHTFGAKFIGEAFARSPQLEFIEEFQTPLYRIQLFQRRTQPVPGSDPTPKKIERIDQVDYDPLPLEIAERVVLTQTPEKQLSILSWERVCAPNDRETGSQTTPEVFESQLRYLRDAGYRSISLPRWGYSVMDDIPVNQKLISIVIENADSSFVKYAWPLLKKYRFSATLFLYANEVAKLKATDSVKTDNALMEWKPLRQLQAEGVKFASRGLSRDASSPVSWTEAWQSIQRSREILEAALETPILTFAYPTGGLNPAFQYLVGLAGYDFAISTKTGICTKQDSLLALPRLAINDSTDLKNLLPD